MKALIGFEKEFKIILNNLIEKKLNNSVLVCGNKGIGKYFFFTKICFWILISLSFNKS